MSTLSTRFRWLLALFLLFGTFSAGAQKAKPQCYAKIELSHTPKFVGDSWPYKDNYGLWDYVAYTPYTYSGDPKEPQNQVNPVDPEPDPDTGEVKTWTFNSFPNDWNRWARADVDNNNKIVNGKLVLTTSANCSVSKIFNKNR